ncbi:lipase 3 [Leptinotarsa decemlineata]|uniref:lipase 3 n=1 Tax=Leptinotarsa decemlineata TaxID=7539 RepID=UPI003D30C96E
MMRSEQNISFVICLNLVCFWIISEATVINVKRFNNESTEMLTTRLESISVFDIEKLVRGYGYTFEKHPVSTEDGFNLELHRISKQNKVQNEADAEESKPVVLIMHDILGTSADFLISGPANSLAFQLANQGYDVWLGNNRGNTWSRSHDNLKTTDKKFWDFSYHELGVYDAPAMIDYILEQTKQSDLSYVGFSQGATQLFVMLSEKPEYNEKIKIMTALAPMVYMKNVNHIVLKLIAHLDGLVEWTEKTLNIHEFLSHDSIISTAGNILCGNHSIVQGMCSFVMSFFLGFDSESTKKEMLSHLLEVYPGGSSLKEFRHYAQGISTGKFRQYNYGIMANFEKYKNGTPPEYDLKRIKTPVALFYGQNDWLVNVKDEDKLKSELTNVVDNYLIKNEHFNHGDFIFSGDANSLVNFYVINTLNKYNNKTEMTSTISTTVATTSKPSSASTDKKPTTISSTSKPTTTDQPSSSCTTYSSSFLVFIHIFSTGFVGVIMKY